VRIELRCHRSDVSIDIYATARSPEKRFELLRMLGCRAPDELIKRVLAAVKVAGRTERRAVEAYGDRRHRDGACVLPCTWLLHEGFAVHREHPRYPLLRLSVKSTARWAEPLEHAVEQALERMGVSPEPSPQRTGG
jgi:hypothetical protein